MGVEARNARLEGPAADGNLRTCGARAGIRTTLITMRAERSDGGRQKDFLLGPLPGARSTGSRPKSQVSLVQLPAAAQEVPGPKAR